MEEIWEHLNAKGAEPIESKRLAVSERETTVQGLRKRGGTEIQSINGELASDWRKGT